MTYVKLIHADVVGGMQSLEAGCIDLIVTSPPYNVGKSYEIGTSEDEYSDLVNGACAEFKRNVVGIERDQGYCDKIRSSNAFNQATLDNSVEYVYEELAQ